MLRLRVVVATIAAAVFVVAFCGGDKNEHLLVFFWYYLPCKKYYPK